MQKNIILLLFSITFSCLGCLAVENTGELTTYEHVQMQDLDDLATQIEDYQNLSTDDSDAILLARSEIRSVLFGISKTLNRLIASEGVSELRESDKRMINRFNRLVRSSDTSVAVWEISMWPDKDVPLLDNGEVMNLLATNVVLKHSKGYNRGICGVFNPKKNRIEWRESTAYARGIAGVYNPALEKVEWRQAKGDARGIAGVYNSVTQQVEWKESKAYARGVAGVYNRSTQRVEWNEAKGFSRTVAGAYNPVTRKVEWKTSGYARAITAIYSPISKQIEWFEPGRYGRGMAVAALGQVTTHSTCGFAPDDDDD